MNNLNEIIDFYKNNKKDIEISLEELKAQISGYSNIVLYGAGSAGIAFFNYLSDNGIDVAAFSDGDSQKWDTQLEGLIIISPDSIIDRFGKDVLVVVTINTDGKNYCRDFKEALLSSGHAGVHESLKKVGCQNVIDYVFFKRCFSLFSGGAYNLPACGDVHLMEKNIDSLMSVYTNLYDEESKELFCKIIESRMLCRYVQMKVYPEENMYFEYDYFKKNKNDIFVDCGACGGSSLKIFLEKNKDEFEKVYCIEPDTYNYANLRKYVSNLSEKINKKIYCVNKAVYDCCGETSFFELKGPGTFVSSGGNDKIETITIDAILDGEKATIIKMNIEGSEIPALIGAQNTIKKYKPNLAIMGYHKASDIWEVPLLIKRLNPDYRLYLRTYMGDISFCYFAV